MEDLFILQWKKRDSNTWQNLQDCNDEGIFAVAAFDSIEAAQEGLAEWYGAIPDEDYRIVSVQVPTS